MPASQHYRLVIATEAMDPYPFGLWADPFWWHEGCLDGGLGRPQF